MSGYSRRREVRPRTGIFRDERLILQKIEDSTASNPFRANQPAKPSITVYAYNQITKEEYKASCDTEDRDFTGRIASQLYMAATSREEVMATRERIDQLEADILLMMAEKFAGLL